MVAAAAMCLVAALAAPTAGAAGNASKAKSASTAQVAKAAKQAKAQAAVSKKKLAQRIGRNSRKIRRIRKNIRGFGTELRDLITNGDKSIDAKINGIVGVVTPILTQLGDGLVALRDGSLALKAGLEELAAKTIAGFDTVEAALTDLGDFATANEYGLTAIYTFAPGDDPNADDPCCRIIPAPSADIPDSGTPATASGEFPIAVVPSGTSPPNRVVPNTKIALGSVIKSNESDGQATGDPAGQVGALLMVFCAGGGAGGGCGDDGDNATGQPEFRSGQLMCVVGPTNVSEFETPAGPTNQSLVNIQQKSSFTDPTLPPLEPFNGTSLVNPLVDAENASGTGNASEGSCTLTSYGAYRVSLQSQFVDIPTSATPGPTD